MGVLRRVVATASLLLLSTALPVPSATAAPGAGIGWVRLGHLSPEVPPVDIYLSEFGQPEQVVVRKAGYGAVTPYSSLAPGAYTVAMRPADAAPTTPPALSATVDITGGTTYSLLVFATGSGGTLRGDLVVDDQRPPAQGTGRVRVVQGAAAQAPVSVDVTGHRPLADTAAYGVTTPYQDLPPGAHQLLLRGTAAQSPATVDVAAGSKTTLLVTEVDGQLKATPLVDAAGPGVKPLLGVETGGGGAAGGLPVWVPLLLCAAVVAVGATRFRAHRA
ncbi:DUF4397 domain-containing protein [Actinokineospora bangkokensis]|uniref:Peptidase n=1 Tax=Actinokineospora bangkokensis TaxID=1193682 RepID=A0A1Q9LQ86_9PSEU|nr:DUF4397 domain-containing protein [Actinokineospora bangkokensis]OLR94206.1 peptidase [Actinokineospora bangkokensis]